MCSTAVWTNLYSSSKSLFLAESTKHKFYTASRYKFSPPGKGLHATWLTKWPKQMCFKCRFDQVPRFIFIVFRIKTPSYNKSKFFPLKLNFSHIMMGIYLWTTSTMEFHQKSASDSMRLEPQFSFPPFPVLHFYWSRACNFPILLARGIWSHLE